MNKYRTPTIEELMTDGFEYEVRTQTKGEKLGSYGLIDFSKDSAKNQMKSVYAKEDKWEKKTKVTLSGTNTVVLDNGVSYTWTYLDEWDNPYQQRDYLLKILEAGNIRTKII